MTACTASATGSFAWAIRARMNSFNYFVKPNYFSLTYCKPADVPFSSNCPFPGGWGLTPLFGTGTNRCQHRSVGVAAHPRSHSRKPLEIKGVLVTSCMARGLAYLF